MPLPACYRKKGKKTDECYLFTMITIWKLKQHPRIRLSGKLVRLLSTRLCFCWSTKFFPPVISGTWRGNKFDSIAITSARKRSARWSSETGRFLGFRSFRLSPSHRDSRSFVWKRETLGDRFEQRRSFLKQFLPRCLQFEAICCLESFQSEVIGNN